MKAWHEDDNFWQVAAPWLFPQDRWENAEQEVDNLLKLMELPEGASVLDLACGPGRHALEFARRGFHVTGVDRTQKYLAEARRRSKEAGLTVEWIEADMREFQRPGEFDAAVSLFTSFGYFENPEEDITVLANVLDALKQGGRLVIDMVGKEVLARIFQPRDWDRLDDGSIALFERRITRDWSWIENTWILYHDGRFQEFQLGHRLYAAAELKAMLEGVGFERISVYGGTDGCAYDNKAKRLVVLAQRTKEEQ